MGRQSFEAPSSVKAVTRVNGRGEQVFKQMFSDSCSVCLRLSQCHFSTHLATSSANSVRATELGTVDIKFQYLFSRCPESQRNDQYKAIAITKGRTKGHGVNHKKGLAASRDRGWKA